jgi:hypothetical protein
MEPTVLPNGVNTLGQQAAAPMPIDQPMQAAPPISQPAPMSTPPMPEAPAASGKWNWLEIGAGIVIVTIACYSVYYFRYKTRQYPEKLKEQDSKIAALKADVDAMKNPNG